MELLHKIPRRKSKLIFCVNGGIISMMKRGQIMNSMEKKNLLGSKYVQFFIVAAVFAGFMFFGTPGGSSNVWGYEFRGHNDLAVVHGSIVVEGSNFERFFGGVLSFNEAISEATHMEYSFFFYDDGVRIGVFSTSFPLEPDEEYHFFMLSSSSSSITGGRLISRLNDMADSLHFEMTITFANGAVLDSAFAMEAIDAFGF